MYKVRKGWRARMSRVMHRIGQRLYAAARPSRLAGPFASISGSADTELSGSLTNLRGRSRALVRDASYAKRARKVVIDNVIGTGIGLQALVAGARGDLRKNVNEDIERQFRLWSRAESCHTGGRLCFQDLERAAFGEVFEAGDVFIRKHIAAFGTSRVPFALELIESERLADEYQSPQITRDSGNDVRMGVEVDAFFRPVAYHIRRRHRSEYQYSGQADEIERVPADQIIHLAMIDRWPQTRGEPWLHTAITRLADMNGYSEAEITRARIQALTVGAIETPNEASSFGEVQGDGSVEMEAEAGVYKRLQPGEKFVSGPTGAPNSALDPFMRYMLREVAAGVGVSYESLSRDYSQSNYSSSRLALIEDREAWRYLQQWFIRSFREPLHREWMQMAVASRVIESISPDQFFADPEKWITARFKPRGWSWVDPTKEVEAYKEAIRGGLTTRTDVISATANGQDIEDVDAQRRKELDDAAAMGLTYDTDPAAAEQPKEDPDEEQEEPPPVPPARLFNLKG